MDQKFSQMPSKDVLDILETSKKGLSSSEASKRLNENGKNEIVQPKKKSIFIKILKEFKNPLIILLLFALIATIVIAILEKNVSELINGGIILFIIILNVTIGVVEELKADNAVASLKDLTKPYCKVIRDGKERKIKSENLVIGDIVKLEAGDIIPAELRLIETSALKVDESMLTGESDLINKDAISVMNDNTPIGETKNIGYMSSVVGYGRGLGVVIATGKNTEIGKISQLLIETDNNETPLTKRFNKTVLILTSIVSIICLIIFAIYVFTGRGIIDGFMVAVALAVCVIPEGIVTCLTLTMSMGVKRMSAKNAIVRHLSAVETLGSTQVICSDKTGTLTLNKMTVSEISLYCSTKNASEKDKKLNLLNCMLLCNDATLDLDNDGNPIFMGDPTETALVSYGLSNEINKDYLSGKCPRINELPFDSNRKMMSVVCDMGKNKIVYSKGALFSILDICTHIYDGNKKRKITEEDRINIRKKNTYYAQKALRLLAFAEKEYDENEKIEQGLTYIGLVGMVDPPRQEVADAIKQCKTAGIKAFMITGDHAVTAYAIARQIGICTKPEEVLTGKQLDQITDNDLIKKMDRLCVFARVTPEHKVRIVKLLKQMDYVVAMTGDGVNDAPSIKSADIGVGMGITGTDVTKEVADIILTDDNFATIVSAVEEGRRIFSNILKNIIYLLSTGIAELIILFTINVALGKNLFNASLILWLNFVSDTIPALALGIEKAEDDAMKQPPRRQTKSLFSGLTGVYMLTYGLFQAIIILGLYFIGTELFFLSDPVITTMCFATLVIIESFHAYSLKRENETIFKSHIFDNKLLNIGFIVSILLTVVFVLLPVPAIKTALNIDYLTWQQWLICFGVAFIIIPLAEILKFIVRLTLKNRNQKHKSLKKKINHRS